MEKRIDFLQGKSEGKKGKYSSLGKSREKIEWTAPGPSLLTRESENVYKNKGLWSALFSSKKALKKIKGDEPAKDIPPEKNKKIYKDDIFNEIQERKISAHKKKAEGESRPEPIKEIKKEEKLEIGAAKDFSRKSPRLEMPKSNAGEKIGAYLRSFHPEKWFSSRPRTIKIEKKEVKKILPEYPRPAEDAKINLAKPLREPIKEIKKEEEMRDADGKEKGEKKEVDDKKKEENLSGTEWPGDAFKGTNLIKEQISSAEVMKRLSVTAALVVTSVILVLAADYSLGLWAKSRIDEKQAIVEKVGSLASEKKAKEKEMAIVFNFENRLKYSKLLLDRHIYWTSFFNFLEANTLENVYYMNFDGDNNGNYSLDARAKDFKTITRQIEIFRNNELVKEVSTAGGELAGNQSGGTAKESPGIHFKLKLVLDKKIFNTLPKQ